MHMARQLYTQPIYNMGMSCKNASRWLDEQLQKSKESACTVMLIKAMQHKAAVRLRAL